MSEELKLWEVSGEISFRTLAWAKNRFDAEDAVNLSDYEMNDWYINTQSLSDEMAVKIKNGYADLSMEDHVYSYDKSEPTLKECVDIIKERLEIAEKENRIRNNGQIELELK